MLWARVVETISIYKLERLSAHIINLFIELIKIFIKKWYQKILIALNYVPYFFYLDIKFKPFIGEVGVASTLKL